MEIEIEVPLGAERHQFSKEGGAMSSPHSKPRVKVKVIKPNTLSARPVVARDHDMPGLSGVMAPLRQ